MMMKNPFSRPDGQGGTFLPQDYVARKAELRANLLCLALFGVVMFGVIAAFFVTNRQWLQVRQAQQAITTQYSQEAAKIEQLNRLESQKAEMMEKAEVTTALIEKVPRSTLLSELITRMPEDITLLELSLVSKRIKETPATVPIKPGPASPTGAAGGPSIRTLNGTPTVGKAPSMAHDRKGTEPEKVPPPRFDYTLTLIGVARQNANVADYLTELKNCPFLDNVDLKVIKDFSIDKLELRKFQIEATIKKDSDARDIEPAKDLNAAAGVPGANPNREPSQTSVTPVPGKEQ